MPPKKVEAVVAAPPPPPPDPEITAQQERLDKWNQRVQNLQQKIADMTHYLQGSESKQKQLEEYLVVLQERAHDLAANKKAPPPVAASPAASPPGKPPKGKGAEVPPAPLPEVTPQAAKELEEEAKKKAKIATSLLNLYKKKRGAGSGFPSALAGPATPRSTAGDQQDSPSASPTTGSAPEIFPKPNDVPSDMWVAMLALREERLDTDTQLASTKVQIQRGYAHLQQLKSMGNLAGYAVTGSEVGLRCATSKYEERLARDLAAAKEQAASATPPVPAVAPKKK